MPEIMMPRLSDTMESGELARWLKNVGDEVHKGDVLAEIETDKATMDLESFEDGILERLLVAEGDLVPIGQPVAIVGDGSGAQSAPDAGEPSAGEAAQSGQAAASAEETQPTPARPAPVQGPDGVEKPAAVGGTAVSEQPPRDEPAISGGQASGADTAWPRTSPLARKIAKEHGIDLASIPGSGPSGRIVRADVEKAIAGANVPAASVQAAAVPSGPDVEEIPLNNVRKVTARRLTESQAVPHFFLTSKVDAGKLIALRADVNAALASSGVKASINDLVIRACAVVLREHPEVNSSWGGDKLLRHKHVNVGFAVATDEGLMVPVVHDADAKSVSQIAGDTAGLAGRARDRKLKPAEFSGGTFTVSNLGMFGIDQFTAVINPPEAAILAVGAAVSEPVVVDGQLGTKQVMTITLTVDHRVLDGAVAAAFLRDVKNVLEEPLRIIL